MSSSFLSLLGGDDAPQQQQQPHEGGSLLAGACALRDRRWLWFFPRRGVWALTVLHCVLADWKSYERVSPSAGKLSGGPQAPLAGASLPFAACASATADSRLPSCTAQEAPPGERAGQALNAFAARFGSFAAALPGDVSALAARAKAAASELASSANSGASNGDGNGSGPTLKGVAAAAEARAKAAAGRVEAGAAHAAAGLQKGAAALRDAAADGVSRLQLLSQERLLAFFMLSFTAGILIGLAVLIGLPVAAIAPAKFALPFTLGSACNMAAMGALRGARAQVSHMAAAERAPLSALYVGSMLATLWAAIVAHSYVLTALASLGQLAALLIYTLSYFPGGLAGAKLVWMSAGRVLRPAMAAAGSACGACWRGAADTRSLTDLLPL
jgi:hypothetical protein